MSSEGDLREAARGLRADSEARRPRGFRWFSARVAVAGLVAVAALVVALVVWGGSEETSCGSGEDLARAEFDAAALELTLADIRAEWGPRCQQEFGFGIQAEVLGIAPSVVDQPDDANERILGTIIDSVFHWPDYYQPASRQTQPLALLALGPIDQIGSLASMLLERAETGPLPDNVEVTIVHHGVDDGLETEETVQLQLKLDDSISSWRCELLLFWTIDTPVRAAGYFNLVECLRHT